MSRDRVAYSSGIKTTQKGRSRSATGVRRVDLIPMQEAVFELSPAELADILRQPDFEEDDVAKVEDPEEQNPDDGPETDEFDDDEFTSDEQPRTGKVETVLHAGASPEFDLSPVISPRDVYSLVIGPGKNSSWYCKFEAPNWMYGRMPESGKQFVTIMRSFLYCLANWFEETKQDFLRDPTPANFVKNEDCQPDNCVLLQKGLLEKINPRMPKDHKMNPSYFNRLYDKIWLFWPERNMPLSALFAYPYNIYFKKAWIIAGCLDNYRDNPDFLTERKYKQFVADDYNQYKKRPFAGLNPEERLYVLSYTVGLASEMNSIFQEIQQRCERDHACIC